MRKTLNKSRIILIILSLLGVLIMGYLLNLHFSEEEGAFCNLGEGLSCDIVNKSIYAKIAGIPVSLLGLLYFAGVFAISVWKYNPKMMRGVAFVTVAFLGPSLYLTIVELTVIKSICVFCEASKIIMLAIALIAWRASEKKFKRNHFIGAVVAGILLALITFWVHSNVGPGDKYNEFAQCLDEKGFIMYGSLGCSFCAKQRGIFGSAFQYIEEIECDPRFPHPQTERCVTKNISHTPTWMQEDEEENELYRFDAGVVSLEKLAEVSGCKLPE